MSGFDEDIFFDEEEKEEGTKMISEDDFDETAPETEKQKNNDYKSIRDTEDDEFRDDYDVTILLIEHDMKFVSGLCDEITVLNFGTVLAQGTPEVALNDPEVIKAYIGG